MITTHIYRGVGYFNKHLFAKTGEFRPPKSGEFYLSGAIPEVYQSVNNTSGDSYHIMREVEELPHNPVYKFKKER